MSASSSIALSMIDDYSKQLNSMANANKGFSKTMEEIQKAASKQNAELQQNQAKLALLRTELQKASNALQQAKKNFKASADEANSKALTEAFAKWENIKTSISEVSYHSKDAQTELRNLASQARRTVDESRGTPSVASSGFSTGGTASGDFANFLKRSLGGQLFEMGSNIFGAYSNSRLGQPTANYLGSTISGAASGFAMGGLPGAAIGAVAGLANSLVEEWEEKDNYFKAAVQEDYNSIKQARAGRVTSGTETAASREVDELAFNKLLGAGVGTEYLADLRDLAAHTPLEYDQLTEISRQLAIGFGDESDRMLDLIEVVGDAGSAVGLDSGGMVTIATALSRMQSSDKVTLEYLNLIQERGIDAIGLIGQAKGLTTAQVYDAISKGKLDGSDVVDILQEGMAGKYGGSMQEQSQTYQGLSSTLSDQETERNALVGSNYTEGRKSDMAEQIAHNDSEVGQEITKVRGLLGTAEAVSENKRNDYIRASETVLTTGEGYHEDWDEATKRSIRALQINYSSLEEDLKAAEASGDSEAVAIIAANMNNMLDVAADYAVSAFEQSDLYHKLGEADKNLINGLQGSNSQSYYKLGKEISDLLTQGISNGLTENDNLLNVITSVVTESIVGKKLSQGDPTSKIEELEFGLPYQGGTYFGAPFSDAYGLDRVPYNGYYAMLHEGERVLTAQQARQMDAAGGHAGGVVITGNNFTVREDADVTRIASELVRQIRSAQMVYAG